MAQRLVEIAKALQNLVDPICRAHGVELVDVRCQPEKGGNVVRVIIDRQRPDLPDGSAVSLDDCTQVSRDLSTALDVHGDDIRLGAYRLEVSSPGLERPLVKLSDFERFVGREIKVRTKEPVEQQRRFRGILRGVSGLDINLDQDGRVVRISHELIAQANLVYRFSSK